MLGESEYILIELPMFQRLTSAINLISDLPYSKIILAHPERYEDEICSTCDGFA